jgi:cholesterol transport system auxiliary component
VGRTFGVLIALAVAGCTSAPPLTFDLSDPPDHVSGRASPRQLVVSEPIASAVFDSDRIVVRPHANQLAYLSGVQWSDRLPAMVQARLIDALENAKVVRSVGRPSERLAADATLECEIRAFEIDVESSAATVELAVKLVSPQSGHVIATNVFSARVPVSSTTGAVATTALDTAFGEATHQIVSWTAGKV